MMMVRNMQVKSSIGLLFTDSGCGFHDASWRHDWSKQAYLAKGGGSHGCINMHPDVAGQAFHDLQKNEPVIIY